MTRDTDATAHDLQYRSGECPDHVSCVRQSSSGFTDGVFVRPQSRLQCEHINYLDLAKGHAAIDRCMWVHRNRQHSVCQSGYLIKQLRLVT